MPSNSPCTVCPTSTTGNSWSICRCPKRNWRSPAAVPACTRTQVYCVLQIGYFKAKRAFFHFAWSDVEDDCAFVLTRYFIGQAFEPHPITKHERFAQRVLIAERFGYRLWSADFLPLLVQQAAQIVRRDVTPGFIVAELIAYLNEHKIVRPGYTTFQDLISEALSAERLRLGGLLEEVLDDAATAALTQLLVRDDTLSELAALKQDAKDFGWRQMAQEREKRAKLEPLYRIAKALLPKLAISQRTGQRADISQRLCKHVGWNAREDGSTQLAVGQRRIE